MWCGLGGTLWIWLCFFQFWLWLWSPLPTVCIAQSVPRDPTDKHTSDSTRQSRVDPMLQAWLVLSRNVNNSWKVIQLLSGWPGTRTRAVWVQHLRFQPVCYGPFSQWVGHQELPDSYFLLPQQSPTERWRLLALNLSEEIKYIAFSF